EKKEKRKEDLGKERNSEWELEGAKRKEKREFAISPGERVFLSRLTVSAGAVILFFVFLFFIIPLFRNSPDYLFLSALTSSLLFIFIVIYNF
ncbi:MAG: hypothetical protein QMD80_09590, partial [archaeon]|nr:hypothetical protein [archaeon]